MDKHEQEQAALATLIVEGVVNASQEPTKLTRSEARKLCLKLANKPEPYRGYGHALSDGRFVFCDPSGNFFIRPLNS